MRAVIAGLGSIGKKHLNVLTKFHPEISITAVRSGNSTDVQQGVENIYSWTELKERPDFIVIATPTSCHRENIANALKWNCPLFIEKPVLSNAAEAAELKPAVENSHVLTYVGCNLRFHPCIIFLKNYLAENSLRINEVNIYCGSDLSTWRPGTDFRQNYSAREEMGGGVHLDLVHEIDYCCWLFGMPQSVTSLRRSVSSLAITSSDYAAFHLVYPEFVSNIVLNYYRKDAKRYIELVCEEGTVYVDLLKASIVFNNEEIFSSPSYKMEDTYADQMEYFISNISKGKKMMNDFTEATEVLKIATTVCD